MAVLSEYLLIKGTKPNALDLYIYELIPLVYGVGPMKRLLVYMIINILTLPVLVAQDSLVNQQESIPEKLSISLRKEATGVGAGICGQWVEKPIVVMVANEAGDTGGRC